jgi:hypothetical protein
MHLLVLWGARCCCSHFVGLLQGSSQGLHMHRLCLLECLLLLGLILALPQQLLAHLLHSPLFLCTRLFFGGVQGNSASAAAGVLMVAPALRLPFFFFFFVQLIRGQLIKHGCFRLVLFDATAVEVARAQAGLRSSILLIRRLLEQHGCVRIVLIDAAAVKVALAQAELPSSVTVVRRLLIQRCCPGVVLYEPADAIPVAITKAGLCVGVTLVRRTVHDLSRRGIAVAVARPRCTLLRHSY